MKLEIIATAGSMLLLGACVTRPATSAEYASCQAMERDMGVADRHDHGEMKGQGRNAMNLSHDRCRQILSQPAPARRSEERRGGKEVVRKCRSWWLPCNSKKKTKEKHIKK